MEGGEGVGLGGEPPPVAGREYGVQEGEQPRHPHVHLQDDGAGLPDADRKALTELLAAVERNAAR